MDSRLAEKCACIFDTSIVDGGRAEMTRMGSMKSRLQMRNRATVGVAAAILAAAVWSVPAFADTTLSYTDATSHKPATRVLIHAGHIRIDGGAEGGGIVLYESEGHRFLLLDTAKHEYRIIDRQTVNKLRADIESVRHTVQALPPSIRDMIRSGAPSVSSMIAHPLPHATVATTGATTTAGKYRCRTVTISVDNGIGYGLCATPAKEIPIASADAATLATMAADLRRLGGENLTLKTKAEALLLKDRAVPVKLVDFKHGRTEVLKSISRGKLSDNLFVVPQDYEPRGLIGIW
jgi:hypothetical protein